MKTMFAFIFSFIFLINYAYGEWESCNNGVFGFQAKSIVVQDNKIFFLSTDGFCVSSDNGKKWDVICNQDQMRVTDFVVDREKIFITNGTEIYLTTNMGVKWISKNKGLMESASTLYIYVLIMSGNKLFVGTNNGVFSSTDEDKSWNFCGLKNEAVKYIEYKNKCIYARTDSGLYMSSDDGSTWALIGFKGSLLLQSFTVIDSSIYSYGNEPSAHKYGFYLSTNNGKNWKLLDTSYYKHSYNAYDYLKSINNHLFLGTDSSGVLLLSDDRKSWNALKNGFDPYSKGYGITDICNSGDSIYFVTNWGNIFVSTDLGANWTEVPTGLRHRYIRCLTYMNNELFAGTNIGIYKSSDNGMTWMQCNTESRCYYIACFATKDNKIYAGTKGHGLFVSTDNGNSWAYSGFDGHSFNDINFYNDYIFACLEDGMYYSCHNGKNWLWGSMQKACTWSVAMIKNNIYASCNGLFISNDSCQSWEKINLSSGDNANYLLVIDNALVAIGNYGIYILNETDNSWKRIIYSGWCFTGYTLKDSIFAVSNQTGLFISTNKGITWKTYDKTHVFETFSSVAIGSDYLFLGAYGEAFEHNFHGGVYRIKLNEIVTGIDEPMTNENLLNLYPNPASDRLSITVSKDFFPESEFSIFNILGKKEITGRMDYINKEVDISSLVPGVYYLSISDNNRKQHLNMFVKK